MEKKVYINRIASYLPNKPISNDEMEDYIGRDDWGKTLKSSLYCTKTEWN